MPGLGIYFVFLKEHWPRLLSVYSVHPTAVWYGFHYVRQPSSLPTYEPHPQPTILHVTVYLSHTYCT